MSYCCLGNTNGSRVELFALLGEVYGSGLPLGYLMLRSEGGEAGGKERYLTHFLTAIRDKWNITALFTLTDKDWSEINAFRAVYPDAKHQLCYWHCLRAVKTRLSILRRTPAHYNVDEANAEFSWIDRVFVPEQQRQSQVSACYTSMRNLYYTNFICALECTDICSSSSRHSDYPPALQWLTYPPPSKRQHPGGPCTHER